MVSETWIMNGIVLITGTESGSIGNAGILKLFRLMRLTRMARMARLLRAMPELMVLIKGLSVAMRSVMFTLLLLGCVIYVFGIAFVQLMKDTDAGDRYFKTVPEAMNSLLMEGVIPDEKDLVEGVGDGGWVFKIVILFYILFASLTVLNMLVGVLCEVVSVVSAVEKESLLVNYVKTTLLHMLDAEGIDANGDHLIAKDEFEALLENPAAAKALQDVGVDVIGLVDFTDFIFMEGRELSFPDFMDMVLQLRGSNTATVKDVVDLRKLLVAELDKLVAKTSEIFAKHFAETVSHAGQDMMSMSNLRQLQQSPFTSDGGFPSSEAALQFSGRATPSDLQLQQINWAAAAATRLTAAATELSAAATELSTRNGSRHQKQVMPLAN